MASSPAPVIERKRRALPGTRRRVEGDLGPDWDVAALAAVACMSEEHLRRLCHRHYERSPGDHLTHL
jgi:transcriptional regulator GlxA family with amidase domain